MDDLISRQAAIDAIRKIYDSVGILGEKWAVDKCQMAIKDLPSAQLEWKTGRWEMKPDPYGFFGENPVCSICGCTTKMREVYKFCPNCGADMRGEGK